MQFKKGDTVQLKSGGPIMTITDIERGVDGTPQVFCVWFAGTEQKYGTFAVETVKAIVRAD